MNNIQSYQSNGWLICRGNMLMVHIGSDLRQLRCVFLEHTHPLKCALSSSRELSMQGCTLLFFYFAGRFNNPTIHPPPSRSARDQPIY